MGAALPVRGDVTSVELRRLARLEADGRVSCRILALANALDGMSREQAAKQAGMDRQTLRDWVIRFNAEGIDGLRDRPRSGRPAFLDEGQMAAFKALVLRGPNRGKRPTNQAPADCEWRDSGDGSDAAGGARGGFSRARRRVRGTDARPRGALPR